MVDGLCWMLTWVCKGAGIAQQSLSHPVAKPLKFSRVKRVWNKRSMKFSRVKWNPPVNRNWCKPEMAAKARTDKRNKPLSKPGTQTQNKKGKPNPKGKPNAQMGYHYRARLRLAGFLVEKKSLYVYIYINECVLTWVVTTQVGHQILCVSFHLFVYTTMFQQHRIDSDSWQVHICLTASKQKPIQSLNQSPWAKMATESFFYIVRSEYYIKLWGLSNTPGPHPFYPFSGKIKYVGWGCLTGGGPVKNPHRTYPISGNIM